MELKVFPSLMIEKINKISLRMTELLIIESNLLIEACVDCIIKFFQHRLIHQRDFPLEGIKRRLIRKVIKINRFKGKTKQMGRKRKVKAKSTGEF